jgi:hypothetical protein
VLPSLRLAPFMLCCYAASINLRRLVKTMAKTFPSSESTSASAPAERASVPEQPLRDKSAEDRPAPDPTRYGDWEKNGRCIDF